MNRKILVCVFGAVFVSSVCGAPVSRSWAQAARPPIKTTRFLTATTTQTSPFFAKPGPLIPADAKTPVITDTELDLFIRSDYHEDFINLAEPVHGRTPLHYIIASDWEESACLVRILLLGKNIDVNLLDSAGYTPLTFTISQLRLDPDLEERAKAKPDLYKAERERVKTQNARTLEVLKLLVNTPNIRLDIRDGQGKTPLGAVAELYAANRIDSLVVKDVFHLLLSKKTVPFIGTDATVRNADGWTPLHYTTQANARDGMGTGILLPHLAPKINITSEPTPLDFVLFSGNRELSNQLRSYGVVASFEDFNLPFGKEEEVIQKVLSWPKSESRSIPRDRFGLNLLHVSALLDKPALIEALLDRNFNADARDQRGRTALFYAVRARAGNARSRVPSPTIKRLIENGAQPSQHDLWAAIDSSDITSLKQLLAGVGFWKLKPGEKPTIRPILKQRELQRLFVNTPDVSGQTTMERAEARQSSIQARFANLAVCMANPECRDATEIVDTLKAIVPR